MHKLAHEWGALYAIKVAARIGRAVPTGYAFNLDPSWLQGLPPELQSRANDETASINEWLSQNSALGAGYATNPDFSRRLALLGKLGRQPQAPKLAEVIGPPKPPKPIDKLPALVPATHEQPMSSNLPVLQPLKLPNGNFTPRMKKLSFLGADKLHGGAADNARMSDFDPKRLAEGAAHEREHTTDPQIAKEIAADHLKGDGPGYYRKLEKAGL